MRYVISDIHGCIEEYYALLEKINFSDEDHLYILGDALDRGGDPIGVVKDLMKRKNVTFIFGNHDYLFCYFVKTLGLELTEFHNEDEKWDFRSYIKDGALPTVDGFLELDEVERRAIFEYVGRAKLYDTVEWDGKKYVLVHAGIAGFDENKSLDEYQALDFLSERIDYGRRYYTDENIYIVTGHTPTPFIRADRRPEVYMENGHIAIDCGCAYGGQLAAYCIETGEVTYVGRIEK